MSFGHLLKKYSVAFDDINSYGSVVLAAVWTEACVTHVCFVVQSLQQELENERNKLRHHERKLTSQEQEFEENVTLNF